MEVLTATQYICDLILGMLDVLDLPVKILGDHQDINLWYGAERFCKDPTEGHMVQVYQKLLLSSA